jgi:hypothetical protein
VQWNSEPDVTEPRRLAQTIKSGIDMSAADIWIRAAALLCKAALRVFDIHIRNGSLSFAHG